MMSGSNSIPIETLLTSVFDRMTQLIYFFGNNVPQYNDLFAHHSPKPLVTIDIISDLENLIKANKELGLALDQGEIDYLINAFKEILVVIQLMLNCLCLLKLILNIVVIKFLMLIGLLMAPLKNYHYLK